MLSYDEMPEDNEELAKIKVEFPYLSDNSAKSCPESMKEILDYLHMESPDEDDIEASDLKFIRTAKVENHEYWIWKFYEADGEECYVTVSKRPDDGTTIGYDDNFLNLTPEQYILGDYHGVF